MPDSKDTHKQISKPYSHPLKAIHSFCIICAGGTAQSATKCNKSDCQLWHYRLGKNPFIKARGNPEGLLRYRAQNPGFTRKKK